MRDGAAAGREPLPARLHPFFCRAPFDVCTVQRHALVQVARDHHAALVDAVGDDATRDAVAALLAGGVPLVVRRQPGDVRESLRTMPASIAVGLPLPPALGKQRLAFTVPVDAVTGVAPPLRLCEAIDHLQPAWRAPLSDLARAADASDIELRVFGAVAWEALTGRPYLTLQSDVDLLWWPQDAAQVAAGIALLLAWERHSGVRADGEIVLADGAAVAWREWDRVARTQDGAHRVLVKTLHGPRLCALSDLETSFARGPCAAEAT
jgi:phosphoribosyl-dephospho-CoA transferase